MPIPDFLFKLVRLTRREYFADLFLSVPVTFVLTLMSLSGNVSLTWPALVAAGWLTWTLYEYAVHRSSHHVPWLRDLHWLHHRNQREYIGLHPAVTVAFYMLTWLVFGISAAPFTVGFSIGHVIYLAMHASFHYAHIAEEHPLWRAKQRHVAHHRYHNRQFGVTVDWWDHLFKTT